MKIRSHLLPALLFALLVKTSLVHAEVHLNSCKEY